MATDHRKPWHGRLNARPASYSLAIGITALATGARYALDPILGDTAQYLTFYLAAMLVATIGGLGPGLLVTGLGALLGMWLFVQPRGVVSLGSAADIVRLLDLLTVGTGVSVLAERLHAHRRNAEAQLEEMLELVDVGHLLVRGTDDRIIRWTAGCHGLYGYTAEEAIGRLSHEFLQTEFPVPLKAIQECLRERGRWEGELTHRHKDGRRVTVASVWVLRRDAAGKPGAVLESNNVSGLRETKERLQLVMDAARIGTWEWDLHAGELEWSDRCKELFGLPPHVAMTYDRFHPHIQDRASSGRCGRGRVAAAVCRRRGRRGPGPGSLAGQRCGRATLWSGSLTTRAW